MHGGYSSFQLVFGKQHTLPNLVKEKLPALEGITTSQLVITHINAMYGARRELMAAQCDERIRRALRQLSGTTQQGRKCTTGGTVTGWSDMAWPL